MVIDIEALEAMSKSFQTIFYEKLQSTEVKHPLLASRVPSTTRHNMYGWLGDFPQLKEWVGDRVIEALKGHDYTIKNKSFEATIEVDRDDIEDDNLGVYRPRIEQLAMNAKLHPELLVALLLKAGFETECYDGQPFFDADHPVGGGVVSNTGGGSGTPWYLLNTSWPLKPMILQIRRDPELVSQDKPEDESVFMRKKFRHGVDYRGNVGLGLWQLAYGSKQTLDATNYEAARVAMMSFKKDNGDPLGIMPDLLVVPPTLDGAARKLLLNERDDAGATNEWYKTADLLTWPWLA
jgi:phage major head subunit gpT-like protein